MQVTVANRQRAARLLDAVLPSLPEQQEREAARRQAGADISDFLAHMRALKRAAKAERREAERRNALQVRAALGWNVCMLALCAERDRC